MQPVDFEATLAKILARDQRYHREAYLFLREALDYSQKKFQKQRDQQLRHVTPRELLEGVREYALNQFGPMALTVLNEWGLQGTADFGELVFNMVDHGLLSKTESDTRDGFKDVYSFAEAFSHPFLPAAKLRAVSPEKASESPK